MRTPLLIAVALASAPCVAAAVANPAAPSPAGPARVVVLTRTGDTPLGTGPLHGSARVSGSADVDGLFRELGVVAVEPYYPGVLRRPALARLADRLRVLRLAPEADPTRVVRQLAGDPRFEAAGEPAAARLLYTPNDPLYPQQWHLPHVRAPEAWDVIRNPEARRAVVGVIDTGLDRGEPDLAPSLWVNDLEDLNHNGSLDPADLDGIDQDGNGFIDDVVGWDFAGDDHDPEDTHGHGSAVGTCISAATDNGVQGAALGFGVRLMALKAIAAAGMLVDGYVPMLYAADNGAAAVNCSWGVPVYQAYEQAIVDAVWAEDVVIVAAGGDGSQVVYPAGYDHVFTVSATDDTDHRAPFAPYGETVDICAPGVNILTIWNGAPSVVSGTSFAAGMVAGLVGLVRAADPGASAAETVQRIESTAVDIDALNPGYAGQLGAGRIDAYAAVSAAVTGAPTLPPPPGGALRLRCEPNPFTRATDIRFDLPHSGPIDLAVFDVRGRRVAVLERATRAAGSHAVRWSGEDLAAGIYFVRLTAGGRSVVRVVSRVR